MNIPPQLAGAANTEIPQDDSERHGLALIKEWIDPNSETWGAVQRIRRASRAINARAIEQRQRDLGPECAIPIEMFPTFRASDEARPAFRSRVRWIVDHLQRGDQAHRQLSRIPRAMTITGVFRTISERVRATLQRDNSDGRVPYTAEQAVLACVRRDDTAETPEIHALLEQLGRQRSFTFLTTEEQASREAEQQEILIRMANQSSPFSPWLL